MLSTDMIVKLSKRTTEINLRMLDIELGRKSLLVKESLTQRSPSAHRFRFVVSAAKRDSTIIKEVLFDPPSGQMLADR